jgi:hypothetical protein
MVDEMKFSDMKDKRKKTQTTVNSHFLTFQ